MAKPVGRSVGPLSEVKASMARAIEKMPVQQKQILALYFCEDLKPAEIAA